MAESQRAGRQVAGKEGSGAGAPGGAAQPMPRLQALSARLNNAPPVVAQRRLSESLNRSVPGDGAVVQRVYTYKAEKVSGGNAPSKRLPHSVSAKDAERLSRSERDFGTLATTGDFTAAIALLAPGEGNPMSPAEIAKAAALKPYMDLLPHLAGEADGTEGKGGHLLTAMQAKFKTKLHITGDEEAAAAWEAEWNLLKDPDKKPEESNLTFSTAKASTMFPAGWSQDDLVGELKASTEIKGGRELQPSGIKVRKTCDTFYPAWE